jgi:hypothetical protein
VKKTNNAVPIYQNGDAGRVVEIPAGDAVQLRPVVVDSQIACVAEGLRRLPDLSIADGSWRLGAAISGSRR